MDKEKQIQQKVRDTMHALDHIERARTDDFFFARLQARMQRNEAEIPGDFAHHFSWATAAVMIIILLNIITIVHYNNVETSVVESADQARQEELQAFAREYVLTVPTLYQQNSDQ